MNEILQLNIDVKIIGKPKVKYFNKLLRSTLNLKDSNFKNNLKIIFAKTNPNTIPAKKIQLF